MRLLFLFLISLNTNLFSQENKKIIDDFIIEGIELWGIPGMSVVAVNDTSTLFKKSYGKRNYFSDELVRPTIFPVKITFIGIINLKKDTGKPRGFALSYHMVDRNVIQCFRCKMQRGIAGI